MKSRPDAGPGAITRVSAGAAFAAALAIAASLSCGGSTPATSTPPPKPTTPPVTTPPAPPSVGASCSLGNGSPDALCSRGISRHANLVETAINLLVQEKPQIFDLKDVSAANSDFYKVLDGEAYLDGLVANLRRQGACAERDTDDPSFRRILVKTSNQSSESYDVLTPNSYVRRTDAGYLDTCSPASFPIDRNSADVPPAGSGCGKPYPPKVTRFQCKVHVIASEFYTLDSTPLVGPDIAYCASVGFTDGRSICALRPEGAPDRMACENWRVGKAKDTGRLGPTWTNDETHAYCTGVETNCSNHPDSQYQLNVYRSGRFRVVDQNGADCVVIVER